MRETLLPKPGQVYCVRLESGHTFYSCTCGACQDETAHLDSEHFTSELQRKGWTFHYLLNWVCPACRTFVESLPQEELPF
jgi:hypothetical protein